MKIYIDFNNFQITKKESDVMFQGDVLSNAFELLFYNYSDTSWFPTMSQLAPNGRQAGDFAADPLEPGESQTVTIDGVTYLKYKFTIGPGWCLVKGKSNFFIWKNTATTPMTRKCIGRVMVTLNESTETYFIDDVEFNPKVKNYIDAEIAQLGGGPKYFDTAANIALLEEDKGLAVATDTGYVFYWDVTEEDATKYKNSGVQYTNLSAYYTKTQSDNTFAPKSTAITHTGNQLQDYSGNNVYPNLADGQVTPEKLDNDLFDDLLLNETTDITSSFTLQNRYLDKANGNANPDSNSRCTDFIDLSQYGEFFISGFSQYATTLICTYDENKTFLRSYGDGTSAGVTYTDYDFIPQSDEKYAKFGTYQYTTHPLIIKSVEVIGKAENKTPNYLYKKKYVACGDSFTKGDVIASNKVYPYLIAERNNMTLVNMSANGSYAHNGADGFTNSSNSYYYQNIPLDADYITIAYGLNETSTTIGTKDSTDNTTIWGAYNEILTWIITNIPNAKVGIISNDAWMTYELRNALQEIASYYGVSFLDLKEYGKPMMISGKYTEDGDVNSTIKNLRTNQYCVSNLNGHPNELGHRVRSYIIENFLRGMDATDNRYTKKEVETKLNLKADKSTTYTKTEVDTALGLKANASTTYTKTQVDTAIAGCKTYTDDAINNFRWELGSHTLDVTTDSDTKYLKSVPSDTIGCQINKVGGMSHKGYNLINYTSLKDGYTLNNSGAETSATNRCVSDYIAVSPSTTYNFSWTFGSNTIKAIYCFYGNDKSFISRTADISTPTTITTTNATYYVKLCFYSNVGGTTDTYNAKDEITSVYFGLPTATYNFYGIRDSAVTSVVSKGENLFDKNNVLNRTYINSNGSLGTESQDGWYTTQPIEILNAVTFNFNTVQTRWRLLDNSQNYISNTYNNTVNASETITNTVNAKYVQICFRMNDLDTFMLVNGSTAPSVFKPYIAPTTKSIPAQIQALEGYGWGIDDTCYNYIDYDRKVFVQKVGRVDLGSKTYTKLDNDNRVRYYFDKTGLGIKEGTFNTLLDANYVQKTPADAFNDNSGWYNGTTAIGFYNNAITTEADFKTSMSGVYLYYELETPIETDISSYITDDDKYIDVEPSGTLEFTNTYSQDVPSDIDYLIEEVKA